MNIQLRYFARLRESFGLDGEAMEVPAGIVTVAGLLAHLAARGGVWAEELANGRVFRVALDQELVDFSAQLHEGAEVAIFPPVTGG
ncbi:molybdopterin converting factor subunit 1 [Chitinimonas koreensis]|uniref:molybdopterin converting factor subunit 1 n=1 Tax=Chitinimonas koreensis TaxID=356302 RepID=UPI0004156560|nr:molybdopterin converting factor subunit 1 [Chitinimonas koreensis]QNM95991.1 molybdopterin converting factor subunit 1 [Chitinimonas koreensis]